MPSAVVIEMPSWLFALILAVVALALWTPIAWWLVDAVSGWVEGRIVARYRHQIEELEAQARQEGRDA